LVAIGREKGVRMSVVGAVIEANEAQKRRMVEKIERGLGGLDGKTVAVLGLAFKPETDDMRAAPSVPIIEGLLAKGCRVKAFDPVAMENATKGALALHAGTAGFTTCTDEYDQFRHLDLQRLRELMRGRHFFDFRNVYEPKDMTERGFIYAGIGR
jgi:UDPglucose 6-dehydrogenase